MKDQQKQDILVQAYYLDEASTEASIINTDSFYSDLSAINTYELKIYNSAGELISKSTYTLDQKSQLTINIEKYCKGKEKSCFGIFTLEKTDGIANGHFYTTISDKNSGNQFKIHSHQKYSPSSNSLTSPIKHLIKFYLLPGRTIDDQAWRRLALPRFTRSEINGKQLIIFNKSSRPDNITIRTISSPNDSHLTYLNFLSRETKCIELQSLLPSQTIDNTMAAYEIDLHSRLGGVSLKPILINKNKSSHLEGINHT